MPAEKPRDIEQHLAEQERKRASAMRRIAVVDRKYKLYMAGGRSPK